MLFLVHLDWHWLTVLLLHLTFFAAQATMPRAQSARREGQLFGDFGVATRSTDSEYLEYLSLCVAKEKSTAKSLPYVEKGWKCGGAHASWKRQIARLDMVARPCRSQTCGDFSRQAGIVRVCSVPSRFLFLGVCVWKKSHALNLHSQPCALADHDSLIRSDLSCVLKHSQSPAFLCWATKENRTEAPWEELSF